jgi:alanine racemase
MLKWIEIDLAALRANAGWVRTRLKPQTRLMAVLKEDGYGHGAAAAARQALSAGADCLGVLDTAEASALRKSGVRAPIHLLSPILPETAREAVRLRTIPTIDSIAQARALDAAAGSRGVDVHVDIDSGLGRWGLRSRDVPSFLKAIGRLKKLRLAGLSTDVGYVPGKNTVEAEEKLRAFARLGQSLKRRWPKLICHAANSAILMDFPHWQLDMARIGNLIYGINPSSRSAELRNPWSFKARIISVRRILKGRSIGYASEYLTPRAMLVATVPAGYADGLTMEPAGRLISFGSGFGYWGMLGRIKAPFVGSCGMAHVLLDVTGIQRCSVGDVVTLPVRRTAANPRLPRIYK